MKQAIKKERITKIEFHAEGGFNNPELFRLQTRGGAWRYYRKVGPMREDEKVLAEMGFTKEEAADAFAKEPADRSPAEQCMVAAVVVSWEPGN